MRGTWLRSVILQLLLVSVPFMASGYGGELFDVSCTSGMINKSNRGLRGILGRLVSSSTFFSIFKVDMYKACPFWPDDGMCLSKDSCGVECCGPEHIPVAWRAEDDPKLDRSLRKGSVSFAASDEDVWTIQDDDEHMIYVDLRQNPESYTGYRGDSARRAWTAIYDENCFSFARNCVGGVCQPESCKEERVLYRLISGVHTSITMSIVREFLYKDGEMDLDMYKKRVGYFHDRIQNLYFLFALTTRAVAKAAPVLVGFDYKTGDQENDELTRNLLSEFWSHSSFQPGCVQTFDESDMFLSDAAQKKEFSTAFRNISAIMDCVGCEKCKLWGKLEFLGIGTALKILFDAHVKLQRNEIIALFQTLNKISESVHYVEMLESEVAKREQAAMPEVPDDPCTCGKDSSGRLLASVAVAAVAVLLLFVMIRFLRSSMFSKSKTFSTPAVKRSGSAPRKKAD